MQVTQKQVFKLHNVKPATRVTDSPIKHTKYQKIEQKHKHLHQIASLMLPIIVDILNHN